MILRRAHVFGLGVTGRAAVEWLVNDGWTVVASDDGDSENLRKSATVLRALGAEVFLGGHNDALVRPAGLVVLSPGIPPLTPAIQERVRQGAEVIGEIELGWRHSKGTFAAITGSNGKSTTTVLLGEIFKQSGRPAFAVGNIGKPLIEIAGQTTADSLISLELSSYQLESIVNFRPKVSALLNISPDHLERHGNLENYGRAKARIWENQTEADFLVFNADDLAVVELVANSRATKVPFSLAGPLTKGGWLECDDFVFILPDKQSWKVSRRTSTLPGRHNEANLLAAILMAKLVGVTDEAVIAGVEAFKGLPHRLEMIRQFEGVYYINDSKATNVDAGKWALAATEPPVILLAGGRPKKGGFKEIRDTISGKVKMIVTFGEAAPEIERDLGDLVQVIPTTTLADALGIAREHAVPGDTVLLSPLCASFDQFNNFEHRGEVFRQLVTDMK